MKNTIATENASVRYFVVAGTQRSGTTLIRTALNSHPQVVCEGELFHMRRLFRKLPRNSYGMPGYRWWLDGKIDRWLTHVFLRKKSVSNYLDWFVQDYQSGMLGFKLMWGQAMRFPGVLTYMEKNNFNMLHVRRRNVLRVLVSRVVASKHRIYHSKNKSNRSLPSVILPTGNLISELEKITTVNEAWERYGQRLPYMKVDYEEYVKNKDAESRRMLEFLGVSTDVSIQSPLVKVTPDNLDKVVSNYDDVEKILIGTKYEIMLD